MPSPSFLGAGGRDRPFEVANLAAYTARIFRSSERPRRIGGRGFARHGGRMTMQLIDKVAIVTGAGSGIGKEIARHFANEGAKVAIADINLDAARGAAAEIDPAARRHSHWRWT